MKFPRPLRFGCPFCHRVFARSFSRLRLGQGSRVCAYCGRTFNGASFEWPTVARSAKIEYLFPATVRVYVITGLLFETALAFHALPYWNDVLTYATLGVALVLLPLFVYWICCSIQIRRSVARHQRELLARVGYGGTARAAWAK
jgi:hypothetical protein